MKTLSWKSMLCAAITGLLSVGVAVADGDGNADIVTDVGCMQDIAGFGLNCTANDVSVASATNIMIIGDGCTGPGDTVTFTADFEVVLTAQTRHDVGIWFATDGDPNGDAAKSGMCTAATPAYAPDPPWLDLDGVLDDEINDPPQIQDTCGDINASHNPLFPSVTLTVACIDPDGDGMLNLPYCTSWRQPGSNGLCTTPIGAFPGAPSKCKCDTGFNVDIPVPFTGTIEVIKDLIPSDDLGLFNLQVDGATAGTGGDVGDGGTTGPVMVSAGTSADPDPIGDTHMVGEVAGTGTDLADYDSEIICDDMTDTVGPETGTGPIDIFVKPDDDWICTITNTKRKATLTLVKVVDNGNGGNAVETDFTLSAAGPTPISGAGGVGPVDVDTGTYTLSETTQPGYTPSAWVCTGDGTQNGDEITLEANDVATCTITNDDDAPSLTLVKVVNNNNGGTAVPGAWTLSAAGYDANNPQTGTYDLSESGPDGYTLTSLTCSNSAGEVTSVTLGLGEDVTCTFVNDDDAPSLTLVKVVNNNNGGTAVAGAWTLSAAGYDANNPQTGTYDLSESGPDGYTLTSLTCSNSAGEVTAVTLGLGEDVTCTFVNDDDAPSLTLVKVVNNNNGGTAVPGAWTLSAAGYDANNPQTGTYDLSESGPDGYTLTSLTCSNSAGEVTAVTLGLGEDVTCTFVNDDDAPSLTLVKVVNNNNGGTAVPGAWTLSAAGYDANDPQTGTYDLSESGPDGYTLTSLTCSNSAGEVTAVTLGLGEDVTCTFVNDDDAPSLTLVKVVNNNNGGTAVPGAWTLSAAGYDANNPQTGTYDLSESGPDGYTLTSLTCSNSAGEVTAVTLGLGEDVTCTFVNDDDAPSLTLVKVVIGDGAVPEDFTLSADGPTPISGAGGAVSGADFSAGTYTLSEMTIGNFVPSGWICDGGTQVGDQITLGLGESATCTITNEACNVCLGKVSEITFEYLGDTDAQVEIVARRGPAGDDVVFSGTLSPGEQVTVIGPPGGPGGFADTLGTEVEIFVDGVLHTTIHTSCSQPIGPGFIFGDFEIIRARSSAGGPICPLDTDEDGIPDLEDNCIFVFNPDQRDTNGDSIGNVCDADINNDCVVNFLDSQIYSNNFFVQGDLDTDNNGDGATNFLDLQLALTPQFLGPPGPSASGCDSLLP